MPELEKQLALAHEAETVEHTLLRNKVTDEEVAEMETEATTSTAGTAASISTSTS